MKPEKHDRSAAADCSPASRESGPPEVDAPPRSPARREEEPPFWDDYEEPEPCWNCENGYIVTCWDDLCRGAGSCFHGDGEEPCPVCGGTEYVLPESGGEERAAAMPAND
jgi:hypothetical protein